MDVDTDFVQGIDNDSFFIFDNFSKTDIYPKEQPLLLIPYLLVSVFGLVGNAFVLYIILRCKKMWTTINVYVFSLALGDILSMLCLLLFTTEVYTSQWILGTFMCRLFWTFNELIPFTSIYFLTIMSFSIFIQQYFPSFSKRLGPNIAVLTSVITLIICLLLVMPFYIYADMDEQNNCQVFWPDPDTFWNLIFISYRLAVGFLLPLLLTAIFLLVTAFRSLNPNNSAKGSGDVIKESTIMISVLLFVFFIFWFPTHVLEMMSALVEDMGINEVSYHTISLTPYLKCCIFPIIYGFLSHSFKEEFNAIFCCKKLQENNGPPVDSAEKQDEKLSSC
ncbi:somatostatin receptor type 5-like [Hyperolius riggenbachi]|uniref:somatostatin receptor type 5-like n=1 Tax=Hyperolius riggenbachi TaxID=752182 RepID=UPI0035A2A00A